jgi:hypothetical protein
MATLTCGDSIVPQALKSIVVIRSTTSLYKKIGTKFKPIISIDKGVSDTYRTIITQTTVSKRLTEGGFWQKILWSGGYIAIFIAGTSGR